MAVDFPGWITALDAAEKFGVNYSLLRQLVKDDVFTRGKFSTASQRPPIYLRVDQLRAYKRGGIAAVVPVKAAYEASLCEPIPAHAPELGNPVA